MDYFKHLKEARLARRLTLKALGNLTGCSKQYMHMIEKGKIKLSYELAVKIADVMQTTTDEIFQRKPER